jgi:Mn-containing catalase
MTDARSRFGMPIAPSAREPKKAHLRHDSPHSRRWNYHRAASGGWPTPLTFLMTREVAHQKSFEKALYAIEPNFPAGKLPGDPRFTDTYFNMSQGEDDMRGPWNDKGWNYVSERDEQSAVDGGDGSASVELTDAEVTRVTRLAARTKSDPSRDPVTGADLGAGQQASSKPSRAKR